MSKKSDKPKKSIRKKIAEAPRRSLMSMIGGSVVSVDFFYRHKLKILLLTALIILYISTKYQCQTGMETIIRLERNLDVVKTESTRERSIYMSRIRESSMARLADSIRPGLAVQQQPPFVLHFDEK